MELPAENKNFALFLEDYFAAIFEDRFNLVEFELKEEKMVKLISLKKTNHLLSIDFNLNYFMTLEDLEKVSFFKPDQLLAIWGKFLDFYGSFTVVFSVYFLLFIINSVFFVGGIFSDNKTQDLKYFQNNISNFTRKKSLNFKFARDVEWWFFQTGESQVYNVIGLEEVLDFILRETSRLLQNPLLLDLALKAFWKDLVKLIDLDEQLLNLELFKEKYILWFHSQSDMEHLITRSFLICRPFLQQKKYLFFNKLINCRFRKFLDQIDLLTLILGHTPNIGKSVFFCLNNKLEPVDFMSIASDFAKVTSKFEFQSRLRFFISKTRYVSWDSLFFVRIWWKLKALWFILNGKGSKISFLFSWSKLIVRLWSLTFTAGIYYLYLTHELGIWKFEGFSDFFLIQTIAALIAWLVFYIVNFFWKKLTLFFEQILFLIFVFSTEFVNVLQVFREYRVDSLTNYLASNELVFLGQYWVSFLVLYFVFYPLRIGLYHLVRFFKYCFLRFYRYFSKNKKFKKII